MDDINRLEIVGDCIYEHKTIRINYTTYDLQRSTDLIHPRRSSADIMLLPESKNPDLEAPFWHARVLGIYHAFVRWDDNEAHRIDFLWVRWLRRQKQPFGDNHSRLERVAFEADTDDMHAFGFVSPQCVVRGSHLIPNFCSRRTTALLGPCYNLTSPYYFSLIASLSMYLLHHDIAPHHVLHSFVPVLHHTTSCTPLAPLLHSTCSSSPHRCHHSTLLHSTIDSSPVTYIRTSVQQGISPSLSSSILRLTQELLVCPTSQVPTLLYTLSILA